MYLHRFPLFSALNIVVDLSVSLGMAGVEGTITYCLMSEPLELKKTLNLPKTDFPMKASFPLNEPKQLAAWQESNLYQRILDAREGKPLFVLHDGPPYPTGTIHLGTGLNKFLKTSSSSPRVWLATTRRTFQAGIATACPSKLRSKKN